MIQEKLQKRKKRPRIDLNLHYSRKMK